MKPETKMVALSCRAKTYGEIVAGILKIVADAGVRDLRAFYDLELAALLKRRNRRTKWPSLFEYGLGEIARAVKSGLDVTTLKTLDELRNAQTERRRALREAKIAARQSSGLRAAAGVFIREAANGSGAVSGLAELDPQGRDIVDRLDIVRASLRCEQRGLFDRQLARLVELYGSAA